MAIEFRLLKASEIEIRVQSVMKDRNQNVGAVFLLYKDARCDMKILDEAVGASNWQRSHEVVKDNMFCNVSIYDKELQQWVTKQDVGTESSTEAQKGEASDSFKRACVNWGIGRELYTSPFIYITLGTEEWYERNGKLQASNKLKLSVSEIEYDAENAIKNLVIVDKKGDVRFSTKGTVVQKTSSNNSLDREAKTNEPSKTKPKATEKQIALLEDLYTDIEMEQMLERLNYVSMTELTIEEASKMISARKGK